MSKTTKLTLAELLRRKEQMLAAKKTKATKDLYISSLDATITITEPDGAVCRDAADMPAEDQDRYMCYECVTEPNLKASEVREAFGCAQPLDVVDILFKPGEIPQISAECLKLAGYNGGVQEVKN